jgi:hypothetical protein
MIICKYQYYCNDYIRNIYNDYIRNIYNDYIRNIYNDYIKNKLSFVRM